MCVAYADKEEIGGKKRGFFGYFEGFSALFYGFKLEGSGATACFDGMFASRLAVGGIGIWPDFSFFSLLFRGSLIGR